MSSILFLKTSPVIHSNEVESIPIIELNFILCYNISMKTYMILICMIVTFSVAYKLLEDIYKEYAHVGDIPIDTHMHVYVTDEDVTFTYFDYHFHVCSKAGDAKAITTETEHWYKCAVCEQEILRGEHHFINDHKDATCTEDGSYDEVTYCTVCKQELSRDKKTITKNGHNFAKYTFIHLFHSLLINFFILFLD